MRARKQLKDDHETIKLILTLKDVDFFTVGCLFNFNTNLNFVTIDKFQWQDLEILFTLVIYILHYSYIFLSL